MEYMPDYFSKINKNFSKIKKDTSISFFMGAGNTANNHIIKGIKYELQDTEIEIIEGTFNRYMEELLFSNDEYDIIHIHESSIQLYLTEDFDVALNTYLQNLQRIIKKHEKSLIIINTLEYLPFRYFGNTALTEENGLIYKINTANQMIVNMMSENVKINDANYISNYLGLKNYYDETMIYNFSYGSSLEGQYYHVINLRNIIKSWLGQAKKGLATDLDNTFWPGIIGDDGFEEVKSNLTSRKNLTFKIYHKMLESLKDVGFFIGINSKNNEEVATIFTDLKKNELFSLKYINWNLKSQNLLDMAKSWNINVNDIVFVDDNLREIEEVSEVLGGEFKTILFEKKMKQLIELEWNGWFEKITITNTDRNRNNNFSKIHKLQSQDNMDLNTFIQSLEIKLDFQKMNATNIERIVQLLNKTNQFNNNKTIFTIKRLEELFQNDYQIYGVLYSDKLGDEGIISVIIFKETKEYVQILNWVMSCRVFMRNIEHEILDYVLQQKQGIMEYKVTEKNNYFLEYIFSENVTNRLILTEKGE